MERLTRKKTFGCMRKEENVVELRNVARDEYRKIEEPMTESSGFEQFLTGPAIDKLAAYEDIGLDPEELKELVKKHIPKPAKVTKDHYMERGLTGVRRHTLVRYSCPTCATRILDHHIIETLDQYKGYKIDHAYVNHRDRRCSCGQLVTIEGTTEKEEKPNG